jgi:L-ascorbate metabolism protein UlaG (beta-lactamase superfamily)
MKIFLKILLSGIFLFANGCQIFFDTSDNIGRVFTSTGKVKNKIKEPVNEGVKLSALWIGHATVLLQMYDKVILTDPWLTDYCAEMQKRVVEPGLDINVLKDLDLILISHSHFDHLNQGSLSILEEKFPGTDLIFPKGLEEFLPDLKFKLIPFSNPEIEKKIYKGETKIINGLKITSVAAYHWGGRYGLDGLLWGYDAFCGFIIEYKGLTVYFAGDTAYDEKFYKYLGENYKINLEFIPIGPCKDKDYGKLDKKNRHVYPRGALKILEDTKADLMIPIHYGTIAELSDPNKPKYVLEKLIRKNPALKDKTDILNIGEQYILK